MKLKLLAVSILCTVAIGAAAFGTHNHYWTKASQMQDGGQIVCQWKCGYGSDTHYTTTVGSAYCPNP